MLREFWEKHADSEQYLKTWYDTAKSSKWFSPNDAKQNYVSASILKNGRVVFNIKGKSYRLVVKFNYEKQWAFIRFIGTQPEYDKINAETFSIQLTMNLRPIKNETDYRNALDRLDLIFDASIDTKEGDEAEILSLMIENYENEHYPIEAPDPIEAIKIRMTEVNTGQKDLVGVIGGKSRVFEILNRKKKLTVEMNRDLEQILQISASVLVNNYKLIKK